MVEGNRERVVTLREKGHKASERTCIVTRAVLPPVKMIRFVLAPDGSVTADLRRKLPGRGVWVQARKDLVREAVRRKLFPRAFKAEAKAADALEDMIDGMMRRDLRQALALANKAGCVISGFAKVESAIAERDVTALVHAQDAAQDGRRKLSQALYRSYGDNFSAIPVVDFLTTDELDLALGRSHVIHAALVAGAGSDGFVNCWRRYRDYRSGEAEDSRSPAGTETGSIQPPGSERNE